MVNEGQFKEIGDFKATPIQKQRVQAVTDFAIANDYKPNPNGPYENGGKVVIPISRNEQGVKYGSYTDGGNFTPIYVWVDAGGVMSARYEDSIPNDPEYLPSEDVAEVSAWIKERMEKPVGQRQRSR